MVRFETGLEKEDDGDKRTNFSINDNVDVLLEILKMLDAPSLGVAACVCRLWRAVSRDDSMWESLCFRHVPRPPADGVRAVVLALGGYRRLYMACVRPVLSRLSSSWRRLGGESDSDSVVMRRVWSRRHEVEISLSLFCVDYYERVMLGADGDDGGGDSPAASSPSLLFLCKAVNV